jgi:integrase
MATVKEVILSHHKKEDATWNVKIRVTHKRQSAYIDTQHFVNAKQLKKDFTIKDTFIHRMLNPVLDEYRKIISELGPRLGFYNAKTLSEYLSNNGLTKAEDINVIEFGRKRIEGLRMKGREASAANMLTVVNGLIDYFKSEFVPITEIRAKMLADYEAHLRCPRVITRLSQFKEPVTRTVKGLSDTGLHNHMRDLRILFNAVREHYNDEDMGVIVVKHYPFHKYKLVEIPANTKKKLNIKQIKSIRDLALPRGGRLELARDLFMLSFYLCGMNAVDIYRIPPVDTPTRRIDYNRSKTKNRRKDRAFISVSIPEDAMDLYNKYAGKLQNRYASHISLDRALSIGMRAIGKELKISHLEFYDARHAFADLARNKCRFSKDDVALALNHKDKSNSVTDVYISKNWDIVDEIQIEVIRLLK